MNVTKTLLHHGPAWSAALLVTTLMTSIAQAWRAQSGRTSPQADLAPAPAAQAVAEAGLHGHLAATMPVLGLFGIALAAAFLLAPWHRQKRPMPLAAAWSLAGAAAGAGAAAAIAALPVLHAPVLAMLRAGALGPADVMLFCAAGAVGGIIFAWLKPH